MFFLRGILRVGKRSEIRFMKIGKLLMMILGMLKFFRVFIKIWFLGRLGLFFFRVLVIINIDLMVLRF